MQSLSTLATLLLGLAVVFWAPPAKADCPDQIIEDNEPEEFFKNPQNERTQLFLSQILQH